jgi:hypothetical protein
MRLAPNVVFRFWEWGLYWPCEGACPVPVRIYVPSWVPSPATPFFAKPLSSSSRIAFGGG